MATEQKENTINQDNVQRVKYQKIEVGEQYLIKSTCVL